MLLNIYKNLSYRYFYWNYEASEQRQSNAAVIQKSKYSQVWIALARG